VNHVGQTEHFQKKHAWFKWFTTMHAPACSLSEWVNFTCNLFSQLKIFEDPDREAEHGNMNEAEGDGGNILEYLSSWSSDFQTTLTGCPGMKIDFYSDNFSLF
jgi:hypothetical protein